MIVRSTYGLQKPGRGVQLNKDHPLCRGLGLAFIFNERGGNRLHNLGGWGTRSQVWYNGPTWVPEGLQFIGASQQYIEFIFSDVIGPTPVTWVAKLKPILANSAYPFTLYNSAGTTEMQPSFANGPGFRVWLNDAAVWTTETAKGVAANIWRTLGFSFKDGQWKQYVDGALDNSGSATPATGSFNATRLGRHSTNYATYAIEYFYVWNRILGPGEMSFVARNPYYLFDRPIIILSAPTGAPAPFNITVQNAIHGHVADTPAETRLRAIAAQSALHGHLADAPMLSKGRLLVLQQAVHGHIADAVAPTRKRAITLQEPVHGHLADSVLLSLLRTLNVTDAVHGHLASVPTVSKGRLLTVQQAVHGHLSTTPSLNRLRGLIVQEALHGHVADTPTLARIGLHTLTVQDSIHGHLSSVPSLSKTTVGAIQYPFRTWAASTTAFNFAAKTQTYTTGATRTAYVHSARRDR